MKQPIVQLLDGTISNSGTTYLDMLSLGISSDSNEAQAKAIVKAARTLRNWTIRLGVAPGSGITRTFTIRINGADTAAVIAISGTDTEGSYTPDLALAAGDYISLRQVVTGGTATGVSSLRQTFELEGSVSGESHYGYAGDAVSAATRYIAPIGANVATSVSYSTQNVIPMDCTVTGARSKASQTGNTAQVVATWYVNGVKQDGTNGTVDTRCTLANTVLESGDVSFSLPLSAGDLVYIELVGSGSAFARNGYGYSFTIVADVDGESILAGHPSGALSTALNTTQYAVLTDTVGAWSSTEVANHIGLLGFALKNLHMEISAVPGGSTARTFSIRQNTSTPAGTPTVAIGAAEQGGSDLVNILVVAPGDMIGIRMVSTGSPAAAIATYSMVAFVDPSIEVPDVVGETEAAADSAITGAGFIVGTVTEAYSDSVEAGLVISQSPTAGTLALPGTAVGYVLSLGEEPNNDLTLVLGDSIPEAIATATIPTRWESMCLRVARRLGDADHRIWTEEEIEGYLSQAYREMLTQLPVVWDWTYIENLPRGFSYTGGPWERQYADFRYDPGDGMSGGLGNFTGGEWERQYTTEFTWEEDHRFGPYCHTSPCELEFLSDLGLESIPAVADLPHRVTEVDRAAWDFATMEVAKHRDLRYSDSRYETEEGEVWGFTWRKDGPRAFRKIRVPAEVATTYEFEGTWGVPRTFTDLQFVDADTEIEGTRGVVRQVPGEHPVGPFSTYYAWGTPRRFYHDNKNVKVEHWRTSEFNCHFSELPSRYVTYLILYAMWKLLWRKGPGQDIRLASWYQGRWTEALQKIHRRLNRQRKARTGRMGGTTDPRSPTGPPRPRLPWQYGKIIR